MRGRAEVRALGFSPLGVSALLGVVALLGLAACAAPDGGVTVRDLDGAAVHPLAVTDAAAHVLVFVAPDCPISNSYAPELAAIAAEHREDPLRFFLVYVDPGLTAGGARQHQLEYGLPGTAVLDANQQLVRATGATVTPEAVVVLPGGRLAYRGRIDDSWADVGRRRPEPLHRDLRDALRAVVRGEDVPARVTSAIGCVISAP
jgi:hypothetical protein